MPLAPVKLDDLTWSELVDVARSNIPIASGNRWTLHAPVDPGITQIELFAWMLELRLYWMDQVPDALTVALLNLLGHRLRGVSAAGSVMAIADQEEVVRPFVQIPEGAVFALRGRILAMRFTTDAGVTLLPMASAAPLRLRAIDRQGEKWWELAMLRLLVEDGDATHELESGRSLEILPADGGPGEATLVLTLSHEIPNPVPYEPFSLLFDLEVPSHVEPQWAWPRWHGLPEVAQLAEHVRWVGDWLTEWSSWLEGSAREAIGAALRTATEALAAERPDAIHGALQQLATQVPVAPDFARVDQPAAAPPPPAAISWWYSGPGGVYVPFAAAEVEDGTVGVRRPGVVRLPFKADWTPEIVTDPAGGQSFGYSVAIRTERATFSAPPAVKCIIPNVALARHVRQTEVSEDHIATQLETWRPVPNNTFELPVADRPPIESSVALSIVEADGVHLWRPTPDFSFHGPADRVFIVDRSGGVLRFGDGLTGRIPVPDPGAAPAAKLSYAVGGGSAGAVPRGAAWEGVDDTRLGAHNVVTAVGGEDAESITDAGLRARSAQQKRHRAVTRPDYELLAKETPGLAIARVHVAVKIDVDINVYVGTRACRRVG